MINRSLSPSQVDKGSDRQWEAYSRTLRCHRCWNRLTTNFASTKKQRPRQHRKPFRKFICFGIVGCMHLQIESSGIDANEPCCTAIARHQFRVTGWTCFPFRWPIIMHQCIKLEEGFAQDKNCTFSEISHVCFNLF